MEHFSHPEHRLIMKDEDENEEAAICSLCGKAVTGARYVCSESGECNVILDKECANLPPQISVTFHGDHRLLRLQKDLPWDVNCKICGKGMSKFGYSCLDHWCKVQIHIECASSAPCITNRESLEHQFLRMPESVSYKSMSYTCEACGLESVNVNLNPRPRYVSYVPYMCTLCHILVHEHCLQLPRVIRIRQHPHHTITHTYYLGDQRQEDEEEKEDHEEEEEEGEEEAEEEVEEEYIDKQSCGICGIKMDLNHGGYRCGDCGFVCHTECTEGFVMIEDDQYEEEEEGEPVEPSFLVIREVQMGEGQTIIQEMKHFGHDHNLILFEDVTQSQIGNNDPICDCCALPVLTSFSSPPSCYGCPQPGCDFFMHTSCATLPRRMRSLGLFITLIKLDRVHHCDICGEYCNGFVYCYMMTQECYCIQCSILILRDSIKHNGHRHAHGGHSTRICLAFRRGRSFDCIACGGHHKTNSTYFTCAACNFYLDMKCAALPLKARPPDNKYDDHDLFLTFHPLKSDSYQSYCLICEEERNPELWFYYCRLCDFSAHVECVVGKYPRIKSGGSYQFDHPHPLTLVQLKKGEDHHPSCHHCLSSDFDLAFECATSQCDYIMCLECSFDEG